MVVLLSLVNKHQGPVLLRLASSLNKVVTSYETVSCTNPAITLVLETVSPWWFDRLAHESYRLIRARNGFVALSETPLF